jgi:hypothetical protein
MRFRRHPHDHALAAWLTDGASARVGRHVDGCEQCLAALERLSLLDDATVAGITEVMSAPTGIEDRTVSGVERRLRNEDALASFFDLFSVGWSTTKVILDLEEGSDD